MVPVDRPGRRSSWVVRPSVPTFLSAQPPGAEKRLCPSMGGATLIPISDLFQLQSTDLALAKERSRLLEIQAALQEPERLREAQETVTALEAEVQRWRSQQQDAELEIRGLKEKIAGTDSLLMSGRVSNPKELESHQANVDSMRRHVDMLEDRGVEALLHLEESGTALAEAQTRLQRVQSEWAQERRSLIQEGKALQVDFNRQREARKRQAAALAPDLLHLYEDLRRRKGGVALARVSDGSCGACYVSLPTGVVSEARSARQSAVYCPSCGRILYAG